MAVSATATFEPLVDSPLPRSDSFSTRSSLLRPANGLPAGWVRAAGSAGRKARTSRRRSCSASSHLRVVAKSWHQSNFCRVMTLCSQYFKKWMI